MVPAWAETCCSSFYIFNVFLITLKIYIIVCISWTIKYLILLMHGATMKIDIWGLLKSPLTKCKFQYNLTGIKGTLHKHLFAFMVISGRSFLGMRNEWDKICRENQNTCRVQYFFFLSSENRAIYEITRKKILSQTGHRWNYGSCALHAGYLNLQTHTQNM